MAARDEKAIEGAAVKLLGAARLLVQSQALIGSAMLTTIDRDAAQYEATQFDVLLYRTASVLLDAAGTVMRGGAQPQFGADMERIVSEIDALVTSGSAKAEASIADEKATLKETRDPAVALLIRKALEIDELERRSFAVAREFASALRALPKGPVGFGHIEQSLNALRIARAAMDEITLAQNAVLARDH
ncbi:MAG: hypothetical protein EOP61_17055 [Sphingomonadales bacterium]|nr:MAG: hypothetical protein EOP61_17055 [Sphingomonadales bacterium]